ncbi:MAG: hypothetical protein EHM58_09465 [Ignavibacteriae bacterium]|nr:MAG: hypothetical protein EHM58_09465 [Ignavibacteriota bacterium]
MLSIKGYFKLIIGLFFILAIIRNIKAQDAERYREGNVVLDNAVYVTQSVPTTMVEGQTYKVIITVRNNGTTTWSPNSSTDVSGYKLALVDMGDNNRNTGYWGVTESPVTKSIEPGETATFELNIIAPGTPGTYPFQWVMKHGDVPFGQYSDQVMINVGDVSSKTGTNTMNSSSFVEQKVAEVMTSGHTYDVKITMTNSGSSTWNTGFYKLVYMDPSMKPSPINTWGISAVELPQTIAPGSTVDFYFTVTAPEPGVYPFQWGLMSSTGEIFGDPSKYLSIKVNESLTPRDKNDNSERKDGNRRQDERKDKNDDMDK